MVFSKLNLLAVINVIEVKKLYKPRTPSARIRAHDGSTRRAKRMC